MKQTKWKSKIIKLASRLLTIDPRFQRTYRPGWAKQLADNMDLDRLEKPCLSCRPDGSYVVIDGQHRRGALELLDLLDWELECEVFEGLSLEEEAELFLLRNNVKRLDRWDMFKAGLIAKNATACKIEEILGTYGLKPAGNTADGCVSCIAAIEKIHNKYSAQMLSDVLRHAVMCWGRKATAVHGAILLGFAELISQCGEQVAWAELHRKLQKISGGASGVLAKAKALQQGMRGHSLPWCVGKVIAETHNAGRRTSKIEYAE